MQNVFEKAAEARALLEDSRLLAVFQEIEADAVSVFMRAGASDDEISAAHQKVRAVDVIRTAIQARIDKATFEQKKGQHRGKHD